MRTNPEIDDQPLADARSLSEPSTEKQIVPRSLEMMASLGRQAAVKQLRGRLRWDGDLDAMRRGGCVIVVDSTV